MVALADVSAYASISDAFKTGMGTMVTDTIAMVAALVPIVIPLLGTTIAVGYTIRFVKKLVK